MFTQTTEKQRFLAMLTFAQRAMKANSRFAVFGGFPRDAIQYGIDLEALYSGTTPTPAILKDLPDNFQSPSDMDVCIRMANVSDVGIQHFAKLSGFTAELVQRSNKISNDGWNLRYIARATYKISAMHAELYGCRPIEFFMDVVDARDEEPPFGRLDFLCNGFVWTAGGVSFSENCGIPEDKLDADSKIIFEHAVREGVRNRETKIVLAKCNGTEDEKRFIRKMFITRLLKIWAKGWTIIKYPHLYCVRSDSCKSCLACSKPIATNTLCIQTGCCQSTIHLKCFREYAYNAIDTGAAHANGLYCSQLQNETCAKPWILFLNHQ